MSQIAQEIAEVEISIDHAKGLVKKAEQIRRLSQNKDFQEVVEKGFFEQESIRLTHLYSDPRLDAETKEKVRIDLLSIGALKRYLSVTIMMGDQAKDEIVGHEGSLDYLRSDEALQEYGEGEYASEQGAE